MLVIIDGYNLLHAAFDDPTNERTRGKIIQLFNRYARVKGHQIVLVFDAGPLYWSTAEQNGRVEVVFSGQNQSADQYIKRYLSDYRSKDILLVSSDRDICHTADKYDIPSIDSHEFYNIIVHTINASQMNKNKEDTLVKLTGDINPELDVLMRESAKNIPMKNSNPELEVLHTKKESKKDRKLWQKIKKL